MQASELDLNDVATNMMHFSLSLSPLFPNPPYNASSTIFYSLCTIQLSSGLRDIYSYVLLSLRAT